MPSLHRRSFLRRGGAAAATPLLMGAAPASLTLALDGEDPVASARPVLRAVHALQQALTDAGYAVRRAQTVQQADKKALCILAAGSTSPAAAGALASARVAQPKTAESLALFEANVAGRQTLVACGADVRGLVYAVTELVDRVRCGASLKFAKPVAEQPANPVRSVMRQFVSELYDKPWFYDRAMWPRYFEMLAGHRFNRFQLCFGLGEDLLRHVKDQYFLFTYPFLLVVPGYDVKVTNLPDGEREKNLQTLRYISEQAVAAGLDFELGLWMHGYEWKDTPEPKYTITGLNQDNHAAYCRDAMTALLKALPAVSSVGLRIHGESGVAEGSYDFWKAVFDGVPLSGRKIELDLHAKGIDDKMLANALATGMPVNVAPKFAAEHMGLPYHQADIRPTEIPGAASVGQGLMALSEGQRSFTRYGYADLLRDDRKYSVRTRIFSGTQRILASGDMASASAYARAFQFCGMSGADVMEPLTCRGRRGSAMEGIARSGYALSKLEAAYDWQKYDAWYRSFGRTMFNPDGDPAVMHRAFKTAALETALAAASRILPLVTQAYMPSAACDAYWPECYWNQPMSGTPYPNLYADIPAPKVFQNTDALDPQLFLSCRAYADELLGEHSGKYSPVEVAAWLDAFAAEAEAGLKAAEQPASIDAARLAIDIEIQALLGRFFAAKMRSGVLFALHERTNDAEALQQALLQYYEARKQYAAVVARANGVYAGDLSVSDRFSERGQWSGKLALIDWDIFECERRRAGAKDSSDPRVTAAVRKIIDGAGTRKPLPWTHHAPPTFTPNQPVDLTIAVREGLSSAKLWYRHVNQAERWVSAEMTSAYEGWRASIPAAYTNAPYPLQYYFEFRSSPDQAWLYPGFDEKLLNQPYIVLRRST